MKTREIALSWVLLAILAFFAACGGRGDVDLTKATPIGVIPTTDANNGSANTGDPSTLAASARLFSFQPGQQVSFKVLADGTEDGGSPIIDDFDGDGMDNVDEITTNVWGAEVPNISTRVVTPATIEIEALSYQTGMTSLGNYTVSGNDLNGEKIRGSERFYQQTLSNQAGQYEKAFYPSGVPSGQVSDFISPGLGFIALAGQSAGFNNGSGWSAYSQPTPISPISIDGGFSPDVNTFNWDFKPDFSANAGAQYRIWKRDKEANAYQIGTNAGKIRIAMYIKNSGSNVPVRLANILASLIFQTPKGQIITAANFRLRDVSSANLYSLEMNANTEFGPYLIEVPNISTDLVEKAIQLGYTPQIRLLDYDMTHTTNSPFRLSVNFTGDNLKVMENNAKSRSAKINIVGPTGRQSFLVAAFMTSTENPADACAPVATPDATSTASPGASLSRALDRAACSIAVGGKVGGVPVVEYQNYVLDFTGVPLYDSMNPKIVFVQGIKKIGSTANSVNCDPAVTNACYIRFADYLTAPNNDLAMWTVFAKGQYFNYSQFDYINTSGSGTVRGYPSGSFNSNARTGAIPRLKGVASTVWAGDNYDVVYMKVSDIIALRAEPEGTAMESGKTLSFNTKWDSLTVGTDPYAPEVQSKFVGRAITGDKVELTFSLLNTKQLNFDFGPATQNANSVSYSDFNYTLTNLSQRFDIQKALQFELSMALGAEKSDWISVLDTAKLAPCNRNQAGNPDVTVDFVAQRFTVCFVLPKGDRSYAPPTVSADYTDTNLYSIYLRPKLLDEYRNVIWPEMRTEVRSFKATLNRSYSAGAQLIEVTDVVGNIAVNSTFTLGNSPTVYTAAAVAVVPANPRLTNITLATAGGLAFAHTMGDRLKSDSPTLPTSQVIVDIGNNYYASWNTYLSGLTSYAANPRCLSPAKNCDFFAVLSNPPTASGAMGLTFNQSNFNWVGHNLFFESVYDYNFVDASRYTGFMSLDLANLITAPGANPISKLSILPNNYIYASVGPTDLATSDSTAIVRDAPQTISSADRALVVWAEPDSNGRKNIWGKILDLQTGSAIGNSFQVNSIGAPAGFDYRYPQLAISGNRVVVVWTKIPTASGDQSYAMGRVIDLISGPVAPEFYLETDPVTYPIFGFTTQIAAGLDKAFAIWESSNTLINTGNNHIRGAYIDLTTGLVTGSDFQISSGTVLVANSYFQYSAKISGSLAIVVWDTISNSNTVESRACIRDIQTNTPIGGEIVVGDAGTYSWSQGGAGAPGQISIVGNKAVLVWSKFIDLTSFGDIKGRIIDLLTGTFLTAEFDVSTTNLNPQLLPVVSASGNQAVVVWSSNENNTGVIRARVIQMSDGTGIGSDFLVSANPNLEADIEPRVAAFGNLAFITYSEAGPGSVTYSIMGRTLDLLQGGASLSPVIAISSGNRAHNNTSSLALANSNGVIAWLGDIGYPNEEIRHRTIQKVPYFQYGLNNFFTAPQLESNYTVTARMR